MIVVDASCVVEVLLQTPPAPAIEERWLASAPLHAPELVDLEVLQVLRRLARQREISEERALVAVGALSRLRMRRWPHAPLRARIWALHGNLTAYDASYVALAERLRCPLLTRDQRLARSSGHEATIEVPR